MSDEAGLPDRRSTPRLVKIDSCDYCKKCLLLTEVDLPVADPDSLITSGLLMPTGKYEKAELCGVCHANKHNLYSTPSGVRANHLVAPSKSTRFIRL